MDTKKCFKCNIVWPLNNFYKHSGMKDGYLNKCKECNKKDTIENRLKNLDYYTKYDAERQKKPERRERSRLNNIRYRKENQEKYRAYNEEYKQKFPEKYLAKYTLKNAIRAGKLKRLPCIVCGNEKSEGHHEDYSRPLDVMWLCAIHHAEHDGRGKTS